MTESRLPAGLLTTKEAAAAYRMTAWTLRQWVGKGVIHDYSPTRYKILVSIDEINRVIAEKRKRPPRGISLRKQTAKQAREANAAKEA